jgi:hypothetical protein
VDEVLFGETFVFAEVDFFDEVFFGYHFTGDNCGGFGVYANVGFGKAALAKHFIFDLVPTIDYLQCGYFLNALEWLVVLLT